MRKILAMILAVLLIAAVMTPAYAAGDTFDYEAAEYLVGKIKTNANHIENRPGSKLYRWHVTDMPCSDGLDVWLSFWALDGEEGNGELSVLIRSETALYYLRLLLNYYSFTEVYATDDTELSDDYFMEIAAEKNWAALATRSGDSYDYVWGKITPRYWQENDPPSDVESSIDDWANSELYAGLLSYLPYLVDALKYELWPEYTLHDMGFCSVPRLCKWHPWGEWFVVREPTHTQHGLEMCLCCRNCGAAMSRLIPKLPFEDVPETAYYAPAVDWAVEHEITSGTSEENFSPDSVCTRAQIVTFLWRAAGSPEAVYGGEFADVKESAYYAEAVAWAYQNGITAGTAAGYFGPSNPCTRSQIVTFLWRANGSPESGAQTRFADVSDSAWYTEAVQWAAGCGVTAGKSADSFGGNAPCTRAEAVTFLWRAESAEGGSGE